MPEASPAPSHCLHSCCSTSSSISASSNDLASSSRPNLTPIHQPRSPPSLLTPSHHHQQQLQLQLQLQPALHRLHKMCSWPAPWDQAKGSTLGWSTRNAPALAQASSPRSSQLQEACKALWQGRPTLSSQAASVLNQYQQVSLSIVMSEKSLSMHFEERVPVGSCNFCRLGSAPIIRKKLIICISRTTGHSPEAYERYSGQHALTLHNPDR